MYNKFISYMHIERLGTDEVQGIELGECEITPKLDGSNGSLWIDSNKKLCAGSRKRKLTLNKDNQGFYEWALKQNNIQDFFRDNPDLRLYGEWLCPHSFKHYRDDAWNKFYIFDLINEEKFLEHGEYLPFEEYSYLLDQYELDRVPILEKRINPSYDDLVKCLEQNTFLIKNGYGHGEGIVIKNFGFKNRYGRQKWAKIVSNEFKETFQKTFGPNVKHSKNIEVKIVEKYLTYHFVDKTYHKIVNEEGGWQSKYIPKLLGVIWHDFVNEYCWEIVKKHKNPIVNFKTLQALVVSKTKEFKSELF